MTYTLKRSIFLVNLAMFWLGTFVNLHAQTELTFRSRTDANAERDLQQLRAELNKAQDVIGPINPLGAFLQRDAEAIEKAKANDAPARLEIGPDERDMGHDSESEHAPRLSPSEAKRQLAPAPIPKPPKTAGVLPGPRYTIVQQASPQIRAVDGFHPARYVSDIEASIRPSLQSPVAFASANLPNAEQPTNVISNFQDIPYGSAPITTPPLNAGGTFNPNVMPPAPTYIMPTVPNPNSGAFNPNVMPPAPTYIMPTAPNPTSGATNPNVMPSAPTYIMPTTPSPTSGNTQPILPNEAINPPTLPYNPGSVGSAPIYSTPIPNGNPSAIVGPPATYIPPPPVYYPPLTGPAYNAATPANPNNNVTPTSPRPSAQPVTGSPFVSNPPCQFDARNMVSREAYRQCSDPCAPRGSPYAPYATQPGSSPFTYVPPTGMAYSNNSYDSGYRPLIGFGQTLNKAHLGRGIVGQPTAYVDGQPVRNFIRYIFP
ncbi:MAG: hypothetical protein NTY15_20275 [Planctomycetota bacterium]|nr:hypothetical protein [Planctomycetota bacterium]